MTDESEIAGAAGAIGGGALALLIGAIARAWAIVMGTRRERAEASVLESDAAGRLVGVATEIAEHAADDTRRVRIERDDCTARLAAMDARLSLLEVEHGKCGPRIEHLEREQSISRGVLADLLRTTATPARNPTPDDVRAEMAREETGP